MPPRSTLLRRALLALLGLALGLGGAELWLRTRTDLQLGFEYLDGHFTRPLEYEPDETRNGLGFHDVEAVVKPEGVVRVVLLGDSYVNAITVGTEEVVGQRLEHYLNAAGTPTRYDVVSVGQDGWGQKQELQSLNALSELLEPDLVITLFLTLNDVRNNSDELQPIGFEQLENAPRFRPGWLWLSREDAPFFLVEGSVLNRFVSYRLARRRDRASDFVPVDYEVYSRTHDERWEQAWRSTEQLILETREASRALGAGYALVNATTPEGVLGHERGLEKLLESYRGLQSLDPDLGLAERRIHEICQRNSIPFLALEPTFQRLTGKGEELHWPIDGHWNVAGNDAAGRAIADFVLGL